MAEADLKATLVGVDARVARIENEISAVSGQVSELTASVSATNANVDSLVRLQRQQGESLQTLQKPRSVNWGWIFGAMATLGAFITLYVGPVGEDARANTAANVGLRADFHESEVRHAYELGVLETEIGFLKKRGG